MGNQGDESSIPLQKKEKMRRGQSIAQELPGLDLWPWQKRWDALSFVVAMAFSIVGAKILQKMWRGPYWEGVWLCLDPRGVVRLRTSTSYRNVPGKNGPHCELLFFLIRKEPVALTKAVPCKPFVSAETLNLCALIGQREAKLDQVVASILTQETYGDTVAQIPEWDSDGESLSESEGLSSSDFREHNVERSASAWITESTTAGAHVTSVPKHSVRGPCWNLNVRCQLFDSLSLAMMFHEHSSWSISEFDLLRKKVFQACVVVNLSWRLSRSGVLASACCLLFLVP